MKLLLSTDSGQKWPRRGKQITRQDDLSHNFLIRLLDVECNKVVFLVRMEIPVPFNKQ